VVAGDRRRVHVRVGVRHQPGASAALPDHERLRCRGEDAVVQLAGDRVPVAVHVFRGPGRVRQVQGLRPDQVGFLTIWVRFGIVFSLNISRVRRF